MESRENVTDAAFVHLRGSGIHSLYLRWCDQETITDAAFEHRSGIRGLDLRGCHQATITGATFKHLHGIRWIDTKFCSGLVKQKLLTSWELTMSPTR